MILIPLDELFDIIDEWVLCKITKQMAYYQLLRISSKFWYITGNCVTGPMGYLENVCSSCLNKEDVLEMVPTEISRHNNMQWN